MAQLQKKEEPTVATPSAAYQEMVPRWDLMDTVLGGTEALRQAGQRYLPRFEQETLARYEARLARNVLVNYVEHTLNELAGKPFVQPVVADENVPASVRALLDDVDTQGTDLTTFAYNWFRTGVAKAWSWVLVEMPKRQAKEDGSPRTLEDDEKEGVRPYVCHILPENVICAFTEIVNGKERLIHVRIKESETVRDGWGEKTIERIRVLEPGTYELFEKDEDKWKSIDAGVTDLDFIPLVPFYAHRTKPPLTDLAHLNIAHWQSSSDQRNILTVTRFPILAVSGAKEEDVAGLKIGPYQWLSTPDPKGKWYYVEHTGAAIEAGWKDLESLERQMANYGAEFLKKKPNGQTATTRVLDSKEALSALELMTQTFKSSLEQVLYYMGVYQKQNVAGTITMTQEFAEPDMDTGDLDVLFKTRQAKDISRQAYLAELQRRRVLGDEFDQKKDADLLDTEPPPDSDLNGMFPTTGSGGSGGGDEG